MSKMSERLALHTWSLDTTPLRETLGAARDGGWNAVELRRIDFVRCFEKGMSNQDVIELLRASGMQVAVLGTEYGLLFAKGEESRRLFAVLEETCRNANALGCAMIMMAPGPNSGTLAEAIANYRSAGEIVAAHGLRIALEFASAHDVINRLAVARELIAAANHPNAGLLLDAYHLQRSGDGGRGFEDVSGDEIFTFQFSDVPPGPPSGDRRPTDRLMPGKGCVRWNDVFHLLKEKNYNGWLSYEAPNPEYWARPPAEVAREAAAVTRELLAGVE